MRNYRDRMLEGADIIIEDWMQLNKRDNLLIVTEKEHELEADLLKESGLKITNNVDIMIVTNTGMQVGIYFDENEKVFDKYNAIIGATDYSIVTTKAAKRAIDRGGKFLSLPLSVRTDESAYGTYHIGFGRNIALGGVHEASGHFDLVGLRPNVYADNRKIMERGRIIVPKPDFIT